jgi:hypothetical protein
VHIRTILIPCCANVPLVGYVSRRHWTKLRAKALLDNSVGVNNDDVFGCRGPLWRRLLGCFLLVLCLPSENLSSILLGSDDDSIDVVSFLGVPLWNSRWLASLVDGWLGGCLKVGGLVGKEDWRLVFLFLCSSVFLSCFFLSSMQGLESKNSSFV